MNALRYGLAAGIIGAACLGCGQPEPVAVADQVIRTEQAPPADEQSQESVAEQIAEQEAALNEAAEETAPEPEPAEEEPRKSPIKIVPTRPMFQNEWQNEPYREERQRYDDEEEEDYDDDYEVDYGPQITEFHLKNLREQQSLYIIRDLMPVDGVLIDRYYKGRTEYSVWEWRSYNEEDGETLVRIRFIDGDAADIAVNPGKYILMR